MRISRRCSNSHLRTDVASSASFSVNHYTRTPRQKCRGVFYAAKGMPPGIFFNHHYGPGEHQSSAGPVKPKVSVARRGKAACCAEINPPTLSEIAGDENLLVFGVTNDMTGYILAPNDFMLHETEPWLGKAKGRHGSNHYHETNSLGFLTAETIADTFRQMMDRV